MEIQSDKHALLVLKQNTAKAITSVSELEKEYTDYVNDRYRHGIVKLTAVDQAIKTQEKQYKAQKDLRLLYHTVLWISERIMKHIDKANGVEKGYAWYESNTDKVKYREVELPDGRLMKFEISTGEVVSITKTTLK